MVGVGAAEEGATTPSRIWKSSQLRVFPIDRNHAQRPSDDAQAAAAARPTHPHIGPLERLEMQAGGLPWRKA